MLHQTLYNWCEELDAAVGPLGLDAGPFGLRYSALRASVLVLFQAELPQPPNILAYVPIYLPLSLADVNKKAGYCQQNVRQR